MRGRALAWGLAIVATCTGCASWDAEARARDRAREWIACEAIELEPRGETAWRASGCGRHVDVACTTSDNEPECIRVRFAGEPRVVEAETQTEAETVAGAEAASESEAPRETDASAALRAALAARAEDVLACAASERVVVRLAWDAEGTMSVSLGGALAGSDEEGCVRAALSELRATPGAPGSLMHLVRR